MNTFFKSEVAIKRHRKSYMKQKFESTDNSNSVNAVNVMNKFMIGSSCRIVAIAFRVKLDFKIERNKVISR